MNNPHQLWHLFWLVPAGLLYLMLQQTSVLYGLHQTYEEGEMYLAEVVDFEIKQIAAQTNGHLTVEFETGDGEMIRRQLSQPIQNAAQLQNTTHVPIQYLENSFQPIVMVPIYEFHRNMVRANIGIALISVLITVYLGYRASSFARKKSTDHREPVKYEIIDS